MKIAVVTGGSRGLGKNTVLHMAEKGIGSIFTYRDRKGDADAVAAEIEQRGGKAVALQLDVGDTTSFPGFVLKVKEVLQRQWQTDKFDFLVNNAGHGMTVPFVETTEEQFDSLMNVHFRG